MISTKLTCPGLERLRGRYARAPKLVGPIIQRATVASLAVVKQTTEPLIPKKSGRTREALARQVTGAGTASIRGELTFKALPGQPDTRLLALWLDQGTRPHVILPRFKKRLRFEVGGSAVFARGVNHPGTRPLNFMHRGFEAALPKIRAIYAQANRQVTAAIGRL